MNIPAQIKILGKKITVKKVHPSEIEGAADWDNKWYLIRLSCTDDPRYSKDRIHESFLHEIIEAIDSFCDLELSHTKLSTLSEILYQTITDNKLNFAEVESNEDKHQE